MMSKELRQKLNEDVSSIMNLDLSKLTYIDLNNLNVILVAFWEMENKKTISEILDKYSGTIIILTMVIAYILMRLN